MSILSDIAAAYRSPQREMAHQLTIATEPRILMLGLTACFLSFIADLPGLAADVTYAGESSDVFNGKLGALFIWRVLFGTLFLYAIAAVSHLILKPFKGQGSWTGARLALMWAVVVATPLVLISGICKVFTPPPVFLVASLLTTVVFFWQWVTCLAVVEFPRSAKA
jgi:hypothetical protein